MKRPADDDLRRPSLSRPPLKTAPVRTFAQGGGLVSLAEPIPGREGEPLAQVLKQLRLHANERLQKQMPMDDGSDARRMHAALSTILILDHMDWNDQLAHIDLATCRQAAEVLLNLGQAALLCHLAACAKCDLMLDVGDAQSADVVRRIGASWPSSVPVTLLLTTTLPVASLDGLRVFLMQPEKLSVDLEIDGSEGPQTAWVVDRLLVTRYEDPQCILESILFGVQAQRLGIKSDKVDLLAVDDKELKGIAEGATELLASVTRYASDLLQTDTVPGTQITLGALTKLAANAVDQVNARNLKGANDSTVKTDAPVATAAIVPSVNAAKTAFQSSLSAALDLMWNKGKPPTSQSDSERNLDAFAAFFVAFSKLREAADGLKVGVKVQDQWIAEVVRSKTPDHIMELSKGFSSPRFSRPFEHHYELNTHLTGNSENFYETVADYATDAFRNPSAPIPLDLSQ
ncbi:hypothetical protein [Hydrogenophaga sp.]|uniref:hypothetical protein n=1 Tax=Hydrogenophaga sp. TaxID=1904254 RepID=UPI0027217E16|nr:hypothetical protein [Hydrogenophaga sp.]MDO9434480.1 hypothetical protein [Hydrogenophaga sp.]